MANTGASPAAGRKMPKRRRKFGRCPSHFLDRKRMTPRTPVRPPRMPANPASSVTPSP